MPTHTNPLNRSSIVRPPPPYHQPLALTHESGDNTWTPERMIVNLNTPPQLPTHSFPLTPFDTPPRHTTTTTTMRPDAPSFTSPAPNLQAKRTTTTHNTQTHARTRSDLLPAIDLATSSTHRRTVSVAGTRVGAGAGAGDLPFPRERGGERAKGRTGIPSLAEITAYYATTRRPAASTNQIPNTDTPPVGAAGPSPSIIVRTTRRPVVPPFIGGTEMLKRWSLSSDTSGSSGWSSAEDSEGPKTPPAFGAAHHFIDATGKGTTAQGDTRRGSGTRLPDFLRAGSPDSSSSGEAKPREGYNALAAALARHRVTTVSSSGFGGSRSSPDLRTPAGERRQRDRVVGTPRRASSLDATVFPLPTSTPTPTTPQRPYSTDGTPGIHVTPPTNHFPAVSSFPRRLTLPSRSTATATATATAPSRDPRDGDTRGEVNPGKAPPPGIRTLDVVSLVPGFRLTPPTAVGQGVSPLRRLEAEIASQQRQEAAKEAGSTMAGDGGKRERERERERVRDSAGEGKREERAERMMRVLGKRMGVAGGQGQGHDAMDAL